MEKEVGRVVHYFGKLGVAVVELSGDLKEGDAVHVKGAHTDFQQRVESLQLEHENVQQAKAGQSVGLKVKEPAHEHNVVYKVEA